MVRPSTLTLATVLLWAAAATGSERDTKWMSARADVGGHVRVSRPTSEAEKIIVSAANAQAGFTSWVLSAVGSLFSTAQVAKTSTQKLDQFQASVERGCGVQDTTVYFYTIAASTDPVQASTKQLPASATDVLVHGLWCYVVHQEGVVAYDMTDAANVNAASTHALAAGGASRIRMEASPLPLLVVSLLTRGVVLLAPETLEEKGSLPTLDGCDEVVDATLASGTFLATACGAAGMKVYSLELLYTNPTLLWSMVEATTTVDSTSDGTYHSYIVRSGPANAASMLDIEVKQPVNVEPTVTATTFGLEALEVAIRRTHVFILTSETLRVFRRGTAPDVDATSAPPTPPTSEPAQQSAVFPCGHWGLETECKAAWEPQNGNTTLPLFHCVWEANLRVCEGPFANVGRLARDLSTSSEVKAWVVVVIVAVGVLIVAAAVGITVCLCRRNNRSVRMSAPGAGAGKTLPGHPLQYGGAPPAQGAGATFAHTPQVV